MNEAQLQAAIEEEKRSRVDLVWVALGRPLYPITADKFDSLPSDMVSPSVIG